MVSSGLEKADVHYFGENNWNTQLELCHSCIQGFNVCEVKSVAARVRVIGCVFVHILGQHS